MEYDRPVADIALANGGLLVAPYGAENNWVFTMLKDMRHSMTDRELYQSLPERLIGRTWAGKVKKYPQGN